MPAVLQFSGYQGVVSGLVIADVNGDGIQDIVVTRTIYPGTAPIPVQILTGDKSGNFSDQTQFIIQGQIPTTILSGSPTKADLNGDGRPDLLFPDVGLATAPFSGAQSQLLLSTADGHLVNATTNLPQQSIYTYSVSTGSTDSSGKTNIFLDDFEGYTSQLLINSGSGTFAISSGKAPTLPSGSSSSPITSSSSVFADVNGDGFNDLIVGIPRPGNPLLEYLNPGNGDFSKVTPTVLPSSPLGAGALIPSIGSIHLINSQSNDLVVTWETPDFKTHYIQLLADDGFGHFTDVTSARLSAQSLTGQKGELQDTIVTDINGDGFPDLVTSPKDTTTVEVYLNDGTGNFSLLETITGSGNPSKIVPINDAAVVTINGSAYILIASSSLGTNPFSFTAIQPVAGTPQVIQGSNQSETLIGPDHADTIFGQGGSDSVFVNDSNDLIVDGANGTAPTTAENDTISAGNGNNTIWGGAGAGSITVGDGNNLIINHFPTLTSGGNSTITLGKGVDIVFAVSGNDTIFGGGGTSVINGGSGSVSIVGGSGLTLMTGGTAGASTLTGGSGPSLLLSTSGHDSITGGTGGDTILGAGGTAINTGDTIKAGGGNDLIVLTAGSETVFTNLGSGNVTINAGGFSAANEQKTITLGTGAAALVLGSTVPGAFAATNSISITGYKSGTDHITLQGLSEHSLSALTIAASGPNATVAIPDVGTITLIGIASSKIGAADFTFA